MLRRRASPHASASLARLADPSGRPPTRCRRSRTTASRSAPRRPSLPGLDSGITRVDRRRNDREQQEPERFTSGKMTRDVVERNEQGREWLVRRQQPAPQHTVGPRDDEGDPRPATPKVEESEHRDRRSDDQGDRDTSPGPQRGLEAPEHQIDREGQRQKSYVPQRTPTENWPSRFGKGHIVSSLELIERVCTTRVSPPKPSRAIDGVPGPAAADVSSTDLIRAGLGSSAGSDAASAATKSHSAARTFVKSDDQTRGSETSDSAAPELDSEDERGG